MSAFQNYFVDTVKNRYSDFKGRATRSEYWYFTLFQILIMLIPVALMMTGIGSIDSGDGGMPIGFMLGGGLLALIALGLLIPNLAVLVRRLHDTGRSGWWYFISLVPYVGTIVLIVFLCMDSKPGSNKWGPNPFDVGSDDITDHLIDENA